jgi:ATP-dependent Clp protease ATP-binding subunit ClpA
VTSTLPAGPAATPTLTATPEALSALADQGFDPDFGARPLRRVIQQRVEDPLSDKLLSGLFVHGDAIQVSIGEDGEIVLVKAEEKLAELSL